jgi:hypothetical protein
MRQGNGERALAKKTRVVPEFGGAVDERIALVIVSKLDIKLWSVVLRNALVYVGALP